MDWQPIETAPKDGTVVDLWSSSGTFYSDLEQRHADMWFAKGLNCWRNHKGDKRIKAGLPTHWRPLPEPPEQTGAES